MCIGISLSKQMFDISFGTDLVYRQDAALNPESSRPSLLFRPLGLRRRVTIYGDPMTIPARPVTSRVWCVNGLGFLNGDWGLWDGGIVDRGDHQLAGCLDKLGGTEYSEQFANSKIHEGRVTSQIAAVFRPTWYQVFPGWDMTLPASVSYDYRRGAAARCPRW